MQVTVTLTETDLQVLRHTPVSVSRIIKQAVKLLDLVDNKDDDIIQDVLYNQDDLRSIEAICNRLFSAARDALIK